jgi:hypothetical protein
MGNVFSFRVAGFRVHWFECLIFFWTNFFQLLLHAEVLVHQRVRLPALNHVALLERLIHRQVSSFEEMIWVITDARLCEVPLYACSFSFFRLSHIWEEYFQFAWHQFKLSLILLLLQIFIQGGHYSYCIQLLLTLYAGTLACCNTYPMGEDSYWIPTENILELIELSSVDEVSLVNLV